MNKLTVVVVIIAIVLSASLLFHIVKQSASNTLEDEVSEISSEVTVTDVSNGDTIFGISYPPVSGSEGLSRTSEWLSELGTRHIRTSVHWKFREPSKGKFDWGKLDSLIKLVDRDNLSLMLSVDAKGPKWACSEKENEKSCVLNDNSDLVDFVTELLNRHGDSIAKIQYGNEVLSRNFYIGSVSEYVAANNVFYDTVKKLRPDIPVVLAGMDTGALRSFTACTKNLPFPLSYKDTIYTGPELDVFCDQAWVIERGVEFESLLKNSKYDIFDMHLYDDPENWELIGDVIKKEIQGKGLIVSEFGGPLVLCKDKALTDCIVGPSETVDEYSDAYHAQRVALYMQALKRIGVEEAYYFKLIEGAPTSHAKSGLITLGILGFQKKDAFYTFIENR